MCALWFQVFCSVLKRTSLDLLIKAQQHQTFLVIETEYDKSVSRQDLVS